MAGKLIGAFDEGFAIRDGGGFTALPFICTEVLGGDGADDDVFVVEDVDVW